MNCAHASTPEFEFGVGVDEEGESMSIAFELARFLPLVEDGGSGVLRRPLCLTLTASGSLDHPSYTNTLRLGACNSISSTHCLNNETGVTIRVV